MWTTNDVRAATVERLDLLVELAAIGRDLDAIEAQFGPHADILAARNWQQRQCLTVLTHLIVWLLASQTETVH